MNTIASLTSGTGTPIGRPFMLRRMMVRRMIVLGVGAAVLAGCGGSDKATTSSTPATTVTTAPPVLTPPTTPPAPSPPVSVTYVTQGAVVGVANASRVNGAAGRLTDRLAKVGFATGTPTDYPLGKLETTIIYYVPGDAAAQAVANSVRDALGGGAISVAEVGTPAPTATGELGNVTVLVAMGNDIADKTLAELQTGTTAPATTAAAVTTVAAAPAPDAGTTTTVTTVAQ